MPLSAKPGPDALVANFADLHPALTSREAIIEARRCLYCFDAPCIRACPTGIDVPTFIGKIAQKQPTGAARTILSANILGASCARVCPTEVLCEGACVVNQLEGGPVKIGLLQRYATDYVSQRGISVVKKNAARTERRVAIIGSGPAGLACAAELAQLGHKAVVFEKKERAGGLNTHGVAIYKMKPETSLEEVELVKSLGVEFRCGVEVGRDLSVAQLEKDFDAIFLGLGLGDGLRLKIRGDDLPEVVSAADFIERIHTQPLNQVIVGNRVAVIGGGNTAIDAATQARRLGAQSVTIIYHRAEANMSAYDFEFELAKKDGAQFLFNTAALEIVGEREHVSGLRLAKASVNSSGSPETVPGSEWLQSFDMVIQAVGQAKPNVALRRLFPKLEIDARGAIRCDPVTGQTNLPKIFAGGDCANGGREVVHAVAEGKRAARGMHALFTGQTIADLKQPSRLGAVDGAMGAGLNDWLRISTGEAVHG